LTGALTSFVPVRALLLAATFTLVSGCQSGLTSRPETRPDETPRLRSELIEAKQRAVMAEVEAERLASKVADLERQLREARSLARQAPPARSADAVIDDVTLSSPRGIEEVELDEPPPPVTPTPAPAVTTPAPPLPDEESPQALYDRAYSLFHEKRYADAEAAFNQFLSRHRSSHLADNAQFWIGESRWARGDFSSALAAFMATVEGFPHGNKVADALLKAGRCLEALGQKQRAVATYQELVTRFPSSAAALSAEQRLQEL
ncbi:MAG: tol-pal system protein YbgF, partial [Acidobacteriota bacterium]